MVWAPASKIGDRDAAIPAAKSILEHGYSYAKGVNDGSQIYTEKFGTVLVEYARRVNDQVAKGLRKAPKIPAPGTFDWATKVQLGIIAASPAVTPVVPVVEWTNVHAISAPGSGVGWDVGPPFEVGEWLKLNLGIHHWPLGYPIGGYMGFMGGDSKDSYLDIIGYADVENERRIREDILPQYGIRLSPGQAITAADITRLPADFGLVLLGYSQSAEALVRSAARIFGEGGVFYLLRKFLRALLMFGNPVRIGGGTRYGRTPVGSGISDWRPPAWLAALVIDVVNESSSPDFYAACTNRIAKIAYGVIVRAETELPFVVFLAKIVIPAMLKVIAPFLGSSPLGGLLAIPLLGGASGMSGAALTPLLGLAGQSTDPAADAIIAEILDTLSVTGLLTSLPDLVGLLIALPGIAVHGDYFAAKPEFGGRNGVQLGIDLLRSIV